MKLGIVTMHRVMNYGSILQAYALQRKLVCLGIDNEIIDYLFPPRCKLTFSRVRQSVVQGLIDSLFGFPLKRRRTRFRHFFRENLSVTPVAYDKDGLAGHPPRFDAYLSGSDQVWNPKFIKDDASFLLSFVPEGTPCAAYASSFAIDEIPRRYRGVYSRELGKFRRISVREESGIDIVKNLTGRDASLVCDPTLLLTQEEWEGICRKSKLRIREKYILVYILSYMYNPYPRIYNIVEKVQRRFGDMKVVYLVGQKSDLFRRNSRLVKDAGPCEYVWLFRNAEFVITTSFHGTAFSAIFGKPLYAVVESMDSPDGRMPTLLKRIGCESALVSYDAEEVPDREILLKQKCDAELLEDFREASAGELESILESMETR